MPGRWPTAYKVQLHIHKATQHRPQVAHSLARLPLQMLLAEGRRHEGRSQTFRHTPFHPERAQTPLLIEREGLESVHYAWLTVYRHSGLCLWQGTGQKSSFCRVQCGCQRLQKLFFVSNRLGNQDTTEQRTELWTLDPETLETQEIVPSMPILTANGATNWAPTKVLVEQQVGRSAERAASHSAPG